MPSRVRAAAKPLQSRPTLCDPVDCSPPGSPSLGFSRQEHWRRLPLPSPGDLPHPGIEAASPLSPELAGGFLPLARPGKPRHSHTRGRLIVHRMLCCSPWVTKSRTRLSDWTELNGRQFNREKNSLWCDEIVCWKNSPSARKRMQRNLYLTPHTEMDLKQITHSKL